MGDPYRQGHFQSKGTDIFISASVSELHTENKQCSSIIMDCGDAVFGKYVEHVFKSRKEHYWWILVKLLRSGHGRFRIVGKIIKGLSNYITMAGEAALVRGTILRKYLKNKHRRWFPKYVYGFRVVATARLFVTWQ